MKKKILLMVASAMLIIASVVYAATFTCYRYVSGHPTGGWISVKADSKAEAETIAYERFKELGGRIDYCKCRY